MHVVDLRIQVDLALSYNCIECQISDTEVMQPRYSHKPRVIQWMKACCRKLHPCDQSVAHPINQTICSRPLKLLMMAAVVVLVNTPPESGENSAIVRAMVELLMTAG